MTENITFSLEELFEEIVEAGVAAGVNDEDAYFELVDGVIEDHRRVGEYSDDQNLDSHQDVLKQRFAEYMKRLEAQG